MTRAVAKVTKQISKKRAGKASALHEKSRDVRRIQRVTGREDKLARNAAAAMKARQTYLDRVMVFQEAVGEDAQVLSDDELLQMVKKYLDRHIRELTQLRAERRKGRPPSKREEVLSQNIDTEAKEFASGFWVPDMRDQDNLRKLKLWNKEWSAMSNIAFVRVSKDGAINASSFPPRGLS